MIYFNAKGRSAVCVTDEPITTGSVGMPVEFTFSSEWDDLAKTAVFQTDGTTIDVYIHDGTCVVPPEAITKAGRKLVIGVYGANGIDVVIPTVYADAGFIMKGTEPSGIEPTPVTPSLVDQILAAAQAAQDAAEDAQEAAQSVRDDADAGAFDGKPGAPGPRGPAGDDYILTDADKAEIARDTAEIMLEPRTATGDTLEITDGVSGVRALSLVAAIEPSQSGSGDPSPENVRPISGLTAVTVSRSQDGGSWTTQLGRTVYGGSLDLVSGVLTIDRSAEALSWSLRNAGGDNPWIRMEGSFPEISVETRAKWLCSKARTLANSGSSLPSKRVGIIWQYDGSTARIYLEPGATLADAQAFMEDVQIVHPLAEPIFVQLTPQEIAMLEGANTFSGTGSGLTLVYPTRPSGGGGGGTSDYDDLTDKPQVNGVTLSGNKTAADLGLAPAGAYVKPSDGIPAIDLDADVQNLLGLAGTALQEVPSDYRTAAAQDAIDAAQDLDIAARYFKPPNGIPKTDLASAVRTSLGKADTALQSYTETDPTVPSWAKQSSKPSYTAAEIGAIAAPASPATGAFLVWNGTAWVAQTLATWQGGSY